ncbi:MAG: hypothetical protein M0027_17615 [Candidatus Dormibacteraeota bacterium]|nr:hypothetical protein [Candidatus Dormibacteraeota bacterium]
MSGGGESDHHALSGATKFARQLGESAQQELDVVGVGVVGREPLQEPLLGVVGGHLDAVDDGLLLQAHDVPAADFAQGHVRS